MVSLQEINYENFWDIIDLKVSCEQENLVASNAVSIAQSKIQTECIPKGIYENGTPVGFVMYCIDRDDNQWWIYRLMIDEKYQSKGYGRKGLELVLREIEKDKSRNKIFLGVDRRGIKSVNLYKSVGFKYTGEVYGNENIMVLNYVQA